MDINFSLLQPIYVALVVRGQSEKSIFMNSPRWWAAGGLCGQTYLCVQIIYSKQDKQYDKGSR